MTKRECAIVSAYTGILCGDFNEFHKYAEELLGRPIWTHEFADKNLWKALKELSKNDFCKLGKEDAEQDLGIDLTTIIKAVKEGVWYHDEDYGLFHTSVQLKLNHIKELILYHPVFDGCSPTFFFKDYGKTWALTKEELL